MMDLKTSGRKPRRDGSPRRISVWMPQANVVDICKPAAANVKLYVSRREDDGPWTNG